MMFRTVIAAVLTFALALSSPLNLGVRRSVDARLASCDPADVCPCCEGTVCPCAGQAPSAPPQSPIAPRPTSDLRVDIAPVPPRIIALIALPIAESSATPIARRTAAHNGVRPQASFCIWRT